MPLETTDVKPESSPGSVKDGSQPSDELAKIKADNERLKGAMSSLQSERDEIREKLDRFQEIENRRNLSAREEAERLRLERKEDNIDDQINELRRKPEAKPWFTHVEREMAKTMQGSVSQAALERAADELDRLATRLSKKEEFKGMTDEKLMKILKPFMREFENKSPVRKVELAFEAWEESETYKKEKSEAAKKKAEEDNAREDGGRMVRESSVGDLMNKKGSLDYTERSALRDKLGIMQRSK